MSLQELKMTKKMQAEFHAFIKPLSKNFTGPEQKFFKDTTFGILKSGSVIVRQISQQLQENKDVKTTCKRLYENLSKRKKFNVEVQKQLIKKQSRQFTDDTLIIMDTSDLAKPKNQKDGGACLRSRW